MRNPRPPQYPATPAETCMAFQPPWPNQQPQPQPEEQLHSEEPPPKKKKRTTNGTSRPWDREAAERALAMEAECQKNAGSNAIVIRFPDPELSKETVQKLHPTIENVHFQAPCGARYCFVTLSEDANVEKVMAEIRKIKFGVGHLIAERKVQKTEENVGPENIDPFTLYVGNLPTNISTLEVKEKFPTATRIDVGYAQKMKYTRYAFVRYSTAEAALEAYKSSVNTVIASRSIILRFRRHKAPVGPPGEKPAPSAIETKPGEKLTVGAKLKAKREKAKAEKV
ncbi:hypothetical protein AAG570_011385 [Ranatra chinensis]|uniref:RRM domain-containing protein n=1 Tax=Ranatra chinensis TaxID=642074 RepID=A0ABD0YWQ1_9HEMI